MQSTVDTIETTITDSRLLDKNGKPLTGAALAARQAAIAEQESEAEAEAAIAEIETSLSEATVEGEAEIVVPEEYQNPKSLAAAYVRMVRANARAAAATEAFEIARDTPVGKRGVAEGTLREKTIERATFILARNGQHTAKELAEMLDTEPYTVYSTVKVWNAHPDNADKQIVLKAAPRGPVADPDSVLEKAARVLATLTPEQLEAVRERAALVS